jgi:release factor glutamine methyltransferase
LNRNKVFQALKGACVPVYDEREADNVVNWLLEVGFGFKRHDKRDDIPISEEVLQDWCRRLSSAEPPQYILGMADFYGRELIVNDSVLIPRPETEELVHTIIQNYPKNAPLTILDIGTGSGCIALSLALHFASATVFGLDKSEKALKTANVNAKKYNASNLSFFKCDFLETEPNEILQNCKVRPDIIVSNPPYIAPSEIGTMRKNVTEYEPHLALFAPEENVLVFYKKIAEFSPYILAEGGEVYAELHENHAQECANIFRNEGFRKVEIIRDLQDKERILRAKRN